MLPEQFPAKYIRPGLERLLWLVDEAAGALLSYSSQRGLLA